jgi:hypothetical protein
VDVEQGQELLKAWVGTALRGGVSSGRQPMTFAGFVSADIAFSLFKFGWADPLERGKKRELPEAALLIPKLNNDFSDGIPMEGWIPGYVHIVANSMPFGGVVKSDESGKVW